MKKLTNNDIFYNTLLANPQYVIVMQSGSLRINDQINQNQEKSSSINAIDYSATYELSNLKISGNYQYTSSINRDYIHLTGANQPNFDYRYTNYSSLFKILTLSKTFSYYKTENSYADIAYYLDNNGVPYKTVNDNPNINDFTSNFVRSRYLIVPTCSINLIEIPRDFHGNYIKPGSLQLNMYVSGVLTASAKDLDKTGKIYSTYGADSGSIIGSVLYDHGFILLTGSFNLSSQQAPYIQPLSQYTSSVLAVTDYLKWIYFGSYYSTSGSAPETKYELTFQGTNFIPTLTMMCHAEKNELVWSNNRTFIEAGQGDEIYIGQTTSSTNIQGNTYYADTGSFLIPSSNTFKENSAVIIKNTISSSFANYSASYEPQVFISQIGIYDEQKNLIGIAKLANPVRKTKELDYTFKLKLDF